MRVLVSIVAVVVLMAVALAGPLASKQLPNGVTVEVDLPQTSLNTITSATVLVKAPAGKPLQRVLVLAGYNEAAASYVPSQPPSAAAQVSGGTAFTPLTLIGPPSYALWPMVGFTRGDTGVAIRKLLEQVVGADTSAMLPHEVVPFERPDEHDWVSVAYYDPAGQTTALRLSVPLVFTKKEASLYLWIGAVAGSTPAGQYVPVSLQARLGELPATGGLSQPVVTSPKNGERVGTSIDVVGRAQPGCLVVIWTEVRKQQDNSLVSSVPGIRHKPEPDGSFHFRVAAPRIFLGEDTPLVYYLHVRADTAQGHSKPTIIKLYPQK
ncbi:MAG: hypothetical protein J7M26_06910 [Armatimonadetes bacterium]|nr:hypothetical protein [Armatimonadota bacterium]